MNQHIFKVMEDPEKVRRDFLFFLLKSVIEQLRAQVHGSTMKHITKPKFVGLEVRIPSDLDEQAEITEDRALDLAGLCRAGRAAAAV